MKLVSMVIAASLLAVVVSCAVMSDGDLMADRAAAASAG